MIDNNKELKTKLTALLLRHDPVKLVCMGVPADEYEPEARRILERAKPKATSADLAVLAREVFVEMFDEDLIHIDQAAFGKLGEEIAALLNA
jgi:hypothetical protein